MSEFLKRIAAPAVLAGSMYAMSACGGDNVETVPKNSGDAATEATIELSPEQRQQIGAVCVNGFDMQTPLNVEFALDNVGGVDSLMNRFTELDENGKDVPVTPEIFADKLLDEVCKKPEVLATITAYMTEPAGLFNGKAVTPNASSLERVGELAKLYRSNEVEAMNAIRTVASVVKAPNGVELVDDFSVIENSGTLIVPAREGKNVTGLEAQQITVGDLFTGYLFSYGKEGLTEKQAADRETIKMLVLIDKDGRFTIKVWIGDQNVDLNFDENAPETTVANTSETTTTGVTGNTATTIAGTTPTGTTPSSGTTPAGPGTVPGTNPGTVPGTGPGTVPGTNPNTVPGTVPGTNPNTVPGTVPGTNPNTVPTTTIPKTTTTTTTIPKTTTTTTIPATTTTTIPATTTTTTPKGPAPTTSLPGGF